MRLQCQIYVFLPVHPFFHPMCADVVSYIFLQTSISLIVALGLTSSQLTSLRGSINDCLTDTAALTAALHTAGIPQDIQLILAGTPKDSQVADTDTYSGWRNKRINATTAGEPSIPVYTAIGAGVGSGVGVVILFAVGLFLYSHNHKDAAAKDAAAAAPSEASNRSPTSSTPSSRRRVSACTRWAGNVMAQLLSLHWAANPYVAAACHKHAPNRNLITCSLASMYVFLHGLLITVIDILRCNSCLICSGHRGLCIGSIYPHLT